MSHKNPKHGTTSTSDKHTTPEPAHDSHGHGEKKPHWLSVVEIIALLIALVIVVGAFRSCNTHMAAAGPSGTSSTYVEPQPTIPSTSSIDVELYTRSTGSKTFTLPQSEPFNTRAWFHYYYSSGQVRLKTENGDTYVLNGRDWVGAPMPTDVAIFWATPITTGATITFTRRQQQ
jgi:hypothetical protein